MLSNFISIFVLQTVIWLIVPRLLREEKTRLIMTTLLVTFLFQFIPKLYHSVYLAKRLKKVTGYIFAYGNIWWRFKLNVIAYLTASHVHYPALILYYIY